MVLVGGGSRGTSPSLDLTFPPTGLSENLGGMERGGEGKGKGKGGETTCITSPTPAGLCLKYHPGREPRQKFRTVLELVELIDTELGRCIPRVTGSKRDLVLCLPSG